MKTCLHLIVLFISLSSFLSAQEKESAFETISPGACYSQNIYSGEFDDFWEPGVSGKLFISTPYHFGILEIGIQFAKFDKDDFSFRKFSSLYYYLGWSYSITLNKILSIRSGIQLGIDEYRFERLSPDDNKNLLTEREFGSALEIKLIGDAFDNTSFFAAVSGRRIFTAKRVDLIYLNFGLIQKFETPDWLKDFLR